MNEKKRGELKCNDLNLGIAGTDVQADGADKRPDDLL
jgi:hypothetical protein